MKYVKKLFFTAGACFLLVSTSKVFAQPVMNMDVDVVQFEVIFANDLDFSNAPNWFQLTLTVNNPSAVQVRLDFRLTKLDDGAEVELASAQTNTFQVSPGPNVFTGNDFGTTIGINRSQIFDAGVEITNSILALGYLPSGIYQLFVEATVTGFPGLIVPDDPNEYPVVLNATNPITAIETISPGIAATGTNPQDWPTFYSSIITFIWFTTADNVTLEVVKALDLNSLESNFDQDPDILVNLSNGISNFTAQSGTSVDPNVDIEKYVALTEGPYLWRIKVNVTTTGGDESFLSDIMGFQIASSLDLSTGNYRDRVVAILEELLGEERVNELFGPDGPLFNTTPTGEITIDGTSINLEELNELVQKKNDGTVQIIENVVQ